MRASPCTDKPLDFLMQPAAVTTLAEAVAALRECDLLCTQIAVQSHSVITTPILTRPLALPLAVHAYAVFSTPCH